MGVFESKVSGRSSASSDEGWVFAIAKLLEDSKSDLQDGLMDGITTANRQKVANTTSPLTTETNYEKLKEQKKALEDGLISQEEYDEYKDKFLNRASKKRKP